MLAELTAEYDAYAAANGVLEMPEGYNSAEAVMKNSIDRFYKNNRHIPVIAAIIGLIFLYGVFRLVRWGVRRARA